MDSGVWLVAIVLVTAAIPVVYWWRSRKRRALVYAGLLILVGASTWWFLSHTGDCEASENPRYREALPGDCFSSPF